MTNPRPITIVGPAYEAQSLNMNAQRTINLYLEQGGPDSKTPVAMIRTPGLTRVVQFPGDLEVRGLLRWRGFLWAVAGNAVFRIKPDWTYTRVNTALSLGTTIGPVSMASSPDQLAIVDGDRMYYYDYPSSTFGVVTDVDLPSGATQVQYLAASFLVEVPNTNSFAWSDVSNVTSWNGTNFASAEGTSEPIVALRVLSGELYVIKTTTIEIYHPDTATVNNSGFIKSGNAAIDFGCQAAFSVAQFDGGLIMLGRDEAGSGIVLTIRGYAPGRVSTYAIERAIKEMDRTDDAIGYTYQQGGHTFYVLNFPSANQTWVYDAATQQWHERASMNQNTGALYRHRSNCYATFNGYNVVGDFENGRLYVFDTSNYTDDGNRILWLRSTSTLANAGKPVRYGSFQVDIEAGVGFNDGPDKSPVMRMRYSNDSGHTWSNYREAPMGRIGQYQARAKWNRCGQGINRVWEISSTAAVKTILLGGMVELQ